MRCSHFSRKSLPLLLAACLFGMQLVPARAAMVSTPQILAAEQGRLDRDKLATLLQREDLQRQLSALGVDVENAKARVAMLTDAEVAQLNARIEKLPAGGDALGVIVLIFVIFIITDAIGATDIFPFVDPIR